MKDDDFLSSIEYRPLSPREKDAIQRALVTGNLTVESLARNPGMAWEKLEVYREVVLGDLRKHPECTPAEVACCRGLSMQEKAAVKAIEGVKWRLLEGMVARLVQLTRRKVCMALWFTNEDRHHVYLDLAGEAMTAFCHAVYRFTRYDLHFNTFLTTVVNNWLTDYCEKLSTVKLTERLKEDLALYYGIKSGEASKGRTLSFDEIVRIIVVNELRDTGTAATERNIEEATERSRERFLVLQQALKKVCRFGHSLVSNANEDGEWWEKKVKGHRGPVHAREESPDAEALLNELVELTERLPPLERRVLECKLEGESMKGLARSEGVSTHCVNKAFERAKKIIGAALA